MGSDPDRRSPAGGAADPVIELVAECLERIDRGDASRDAVIEAFCREHPEHADAVRERLVHLDRAGFTAPEPREPENGRTFGRFEIVGELGHGGMGVVYLARDPRLGRNVALKALASRLVISDRARSRFEREIKAIAALSHPRIVPVYEVGEEAGVPWFTMEHVEGRTLAQVIHSLKELELRTDELSTDHLGQATFFEHDTDSRLLSDSDSSELSSETPRPEEPHLPRVWGKTYVETVCRMIHDVADALQHAHAHGVIHRDVKPSNILIDGRGRALLFDFGLAHVETEDALTQTGDFAGTPFYVAPEQISDKGKSVDLRADVYALGVTLFELLTLRRPFAGQTTQQVFRQILSKDPPLPRRLNRLVPRDLETICLTALEKDPERRYQNAGELAADLRRFLEFRPVRARPVGLPTRTARWMRRNPAGATAAVLAVVIATGVPTGLTYGSIQLRREANRTAREASKSRQINRLLNEILGSANPDELGYDATIREAVDLTVERMEVDFVDPEIEAGVRATIGNTYVGVGDYASAEVQLRRALELRLVVHGTRHDEVADSLNDLGLCRLRQHDLDEAEDFLQRALVMRRALHRDDDGGDHDATAVTLEHLARLKADRGDFDAARGLLAESLDMRRRLFGEESPQVARGLVALGQVLEDQATALGGAASAEAEEAYRGGLAMLERIRGEDHPDSAATRSRLGTLLLKRGDFEEAQALYVRTEESYMKRLGERHPLVGRTRNERALALHLSGANDEAERVARDALELQRAALPAGHRDLADTQIVLAQILMDANLPEDASPLLVEAVDIRRRRFGDPSVELSDARMRLARSYFDQVRLEDAVQVGGEALEGYRAALPANDERIGGLQRLIGRAWHGLGRPDLAEPLLVDAVRIYAERLGPDAISTIQFRAELAYLYYTTQQWEKAAQAFDEVVAARERLGVLEHREGVVNLSHLAECLAQLGNQPRAIEVGIRAMEIDEKVHGIVGAGRVHALLRIGRLLATAGRYEEALPWLRTGTEEGFALAMDQRVTLDASRLYGVCLMETGDYSAAEESLVGTIYAQERFLGVQHPHVAITLRDVLELYDRLDLPEERSFYRSRFGLTYVLRDAGVRPYVGTADDPGYDYPAYH